MFGSAFEIARRAQDLETRRQVFKAVRSWYRGCLVHVGFCCNSLNFENVLKAKVCGRITTSICLLNMNYHDYIVAFLSCERQKNNDVLWEAQVWLRQNLILKWHPDKNKEEIRAAEAAQSSLALIPFLFALSSIRVYAHSSFGHAGVPFQNLSGLSPRDGTPRQIPRWSLRPTLLFQFHPRSIAVQLPSQHPKVTQYVDSYSTW